MIRHPSLQDTSGQVPPTAGAARLATDLLVGEHSLDECIELVAQHFIDHWQVEVMVAALTVVSPVDETAWRRLGDRAWVREWLSSDQSRSILPPPGAGPEAALSMPWTSQLARVHDVVSIVDAELLPEEAEQDRLELAGVGTRSFVAAACRHQDRMFGSLSFGSSRPSAWPTGQIADLRLLSGALTSRLALEAARRSLADSVAAGSRSREVNEQLLASVGHELRTPLTSVLGHTEMLMDEALQVTDHPLADAVQRDGSVIIHACERLLGLVDEVLDTGRTLKSDTGRREVAVAAAVDDVLHWHRVAAQAKTLSIETRVDEDLCVWAHPAGVRQVLSTLVGNAVVHSQAGGSVRISAKTLTGEVGEERVRIVVRDSGAGLDRDQLTELFKPYGRLDGTGLDDMGLGLSLSRSLAERDSGTVGAESMPGSGSSFWVELPSRRTDSREEAALR